MHHALIYVDPYHGIQPYGLCMKGISER